MDKVKKQLKDFAHKLPNPKINKPTQQARTLSQQSRKNIKNLNQTSVQTLLKVSYFSKRYNASLRKNFIKKGD